MRYPHVMLDLETTGTRPGCRILSVGLTEFAAAEDPKGSPLIGSQVYTVLDINRQEQFYRLADDPDTLDWWDRQSPEAREVWTAAKQCRRDIVDDLIDLNVFIGARHVWGNGSDFDQPILLHLYRVASVKPSWPFWGHRCFRTIKALAGQLGINHGLGRQGTHHNASDDATYQAQIASRLMWQFNHAVAR